MKLTNLFIVQLAAFALQVSAARQPYDVRKIIDAFRHPREDLVILCAHRGLRWNGTAENSRDAYFRASEAGIECVETDIRLSKDGYLPMIHDSGLGRETDVGERSGKEAYNPFTGMGYDPKVIDNDFEGFIENLHLRDEDGRVRVERVPTLPEMVQSVYETGMDVVLQLDFKDQEAVAPAYWSLKNLTNAAGVPANEWCIYKLQASWYRTPLDFEALDWVQDAFAEGLNLAFIPVYQPVDAGEWDVLSSLKAFGTTNYTISAEIELQSTGGALQHLLDYVESEESTEDTFRTSGIFFAIGDFIQPTTLNLTSFDTANYTLPEDIRTNNSVFVFQDNAAPVLLDTLAVGDHDYRSDFDWILKQGFNWIITDTADEWHHNLDAVGRRNISSLIADGQAAADPQLVKGWYKGRRHAREFHMLL